MVKNYFRVDQKFVLVCFTISFLTCYTSILAQTQLVAGGLYHSLFVCTDGTVQACGYNGMGQVGDNTTTIRYAPVAVSSLTSVTAVAASDYHSHALKSDGTVWAWGWNGNNLIGDGTSTDRHVPTQTSGLTSVTRIATTTLVGMALKSNGTVWAWGYNGTGELGDGTYTNRTTPVQVSTITNITEIAGGGRHCLALKSDGTVWSWGSNGYGQLGDNTTTWRITPVQVSGLTSIIAIAAGYYTSYALKSDGTVWSWGRNTYYNLGDNTTTDRHTPVQVSGLTGVVAISAGSDHGLAIKSNFTGWGWGRNASGQLGDGTNTNRATPVAVGGSITNLSALISNNNSDFTIAVKQDNSVKTFGDNTYGSLGDNSNTQRTSPVSPSGLCSVILPIELMYFTVECVNQNNQQLLQFSWATATETNNDFFTIERDSISADGSLNWIKMGAVNGAGNSLETKKYEFTFTNNATETFYKTHYYRLRQTDYDSRSMVFDPASQNCENLNYSSTVYPNPFTKDIIIDNLPVHQTIGYKILGARGNIIIQDEQYVYTNSLRLHLSHLPDGIYFLQISKDGQQEFHKIIKAH